MVILHWRAAAHDWKFKNHSLSTLSKQHFAELLQKFIKENVKPEYFVAGFRTSGLYPFSADGIDYRKLVDANVDHGEDETEEEEKELERKKFEVAFECISKILGSEKEVSFFQFHTKDPNKPWDLNTEDTLGYHIWKVALEKSLANQVSSTVDQGEDHQLIPEENLEFEEFDADWLLDENSHFILEDAELEILDEVASHVNGNNGATENAGIVYNPHKIQVLDNTVIVPAPQENINFPTQYTSTSDVIQISTETNASSTPYLNDRESVVAPDVSTEPPCTSLENGASRAESMISIWFAVVIYTSRR